MDSKKQQIVEKLQDANNILLTVSRDPSVDQLAALIGLTILLNKMDKHATAVFSGKVPSTIDFLKPDETIEKNTDSLRDFIIALDKSKADKLRYKVEDRVVKIFITPYKTSLSGDDLEFSQGDFNVDVVLALGVHQQADLDDAITAHGRILHDATVMCVNLAQNGELGSVNWVEPHASSLSELATQLAQSFEKVQLDEQIATALLTGIVAETDRFKNDKTTATTMSLSADLMKAGANQQLVADELEQTVRVQNGDDTVQVDEPSDSDDKPPTSNDGSLEIDHEGTMSAPETGSEDDHDGQLPTPVAEPEADDDEPDAIDFSSHRTLLPDEPPHDESEPTDDELGDVSRSLITEPPTFGGTLTANSRPEDTDLKNVNMLPNDSAGTKATSTPPLTLPVPPEPTAPQPETEEQLPPTVVQPEAAPESVQEPEPEPATETKPFTPPQVTPTVSPEPQPVAAPPAPEPAPVWTPPTHSGAPEPPKSVESTQPSEPPRQETLTELEEAVSSPHAGAASEPEHQASEFNSTDDLDKARQEVMRALNEQPNNLPPVEALNAQPIDLGKDASVPAPVSPPSNEPVAPLAPNLPEQAPFANSPADKPLDMPLPPSITLPPAQSQPPTNSPTDSPDSPPPVPPPFMPPPAQR